MPIYEYECNACGGRHEFIQRFADGPKRKCPECGANRLRKLVSAAAFHLKGSGWYVTDFRDKGNASKAAGDDKAGSDEKKKNGDGAAADATASKSDAKPDAKPEAKPEKKTPKSDASGTKAAAD